MNQVVCTRCGASAPRSLAYAIGQAPHCRACTLARMRDPLDPVPEAEVHPLLSVDAPTPAWAEPRSLAYPRWIRLTAIAFGLVTLWSVVHAVPFALGMRDYVQAKAAFQACRHAEATARMARVARRLPRDRDLQSTLLYYQGVELYADDREAEAMPILSRGLMLDPEASRIHYHLLLCRRNLALQAGHLDEALEAATELAEDHGEQWLNDFILARTFSQRYLKASREDDRTRALEWLEKAKEAEGREPQDAGPKEDWLRHRLATREDLSLEAFKARFPSGWKGGAK